MDTIGRVAYNMINSVIDTSNVKLYESYREDVCLFAPKYFIDILKTYFKKNMMLNQTINENIFFRGYEIKIHPYNEILLVHLNYAVTNDKDLINKIIM